MIDPAESTDPLDNADTIGAFMQNGEAVHFDRETPRDILIRREGPEEQEDRGGALGVVMGYLFSSGPHPAFVLHHLYTLVQETTPWLTRPLAREELSLLLQPAAASGAGRKAHLARVGMILRGTRIEGRPAHQHDKVINLTLSAANFLCRTPNELKPMTLKHVLRRRPGERLAEYDRRAMARNAGLQFFFFDGYRPEHTAVRVFALAKAYYSQWLYDMSVRQLGLLFGVEGATWSERIKQKLTRFLDARNAVGSVARFQKSPDACRKYSQAQIGNSNRRGGVPRVA